MAARIETQVLARQPEVRLTRYARFYAHAPDGSIKGLYVYANPGHEPLAGRVGEIVWTTLGSLPVIYDGGCTVLNVEYDVAADRVRRLYCDASGFEEGVERSKID